MVFRNRQEIQKIDSSNMISKLEQKIMEKLYKEYKTSAKLYCWKITEAYKDLGVSDGDYVGMLNDSKYIIVEGDCFKLTTAGIRYMDSQARRANLSEKEQEEIVKLSPELYGVGINLKSFWRKIKSWFKLKNN